MPRAKCSKCGVKTVEVPWVGKHSRFTLMFEAFAVQVLQDCGNIKRAAALFRSGALRVVDRRHKLMSTV
ncbi:MAG: helix-turn-helix domain-containing protein [Aureliella sp.]